jgi:pyruvate formate lyase activating enzyme
MGVLGRVHSIESFGTLDGPGIRYVLFLQGCNFRCLYCHNPDTWATCTGKTMDSDDVIRDILSYKNFIKSGGVTLSGGEPLIQADFAAAILKGCREHNIHTALDTKSFDDNVARKISGYTNKRTLETLNYCEEKGIKVWMRQVLLPGYTLDYETLSALADYLKGFECVELIELLPFHKMGEYKWEQLGFDYELKDTQPPTPEELLKARQVFENKGIKVLMKG